jgi:hypothetical protein
MLRSSFGLPGPDIFQSICGTKSGFWRFLRALNQDGLGVMPSSEYYRRQADTLLTLALIAADPAVSARYRNLALEYKMLAASAGEDIVPPRSLTDNLSSAADREGD